jgi:hypothetical protein
VTGLEIERISAPAVPLLKHRFDEAEAPRHLLKAFLEICTGGEAGDAVECPFGVSGLDKVE